MFPSSLTSAQLDRLRGAGSTAAAWRGTVYLTLCPNTVIWKTRVATAPTGNVYASIAHGATLSGSASNVQAGMTILSGAIDDIRRATWRGRVRGAVSGGQIPINETSYNFQANDFIWIINDYAIWHKLARDTGTQYYKDWDRTFTQLPPVIHNLQSAYVGFVSGSPLGLTIAFNAQAYAATQGASISSWQWSVPTGATLVSGSATAPNPTYRFDAGFADWISVTVTDSGGRTARRRIFVAAHDRGAHAPRSGFASVNINADLDSGYNATLTAFDPAEFDNVLDNTFAVLWLEEEYGDGTGALLGNTANIICIGRLRRETLKGEMDERASLVTQSEIEIEGTGAQLARLHAPKIAMRNASTPTQWDEINTLTLWRAIVHVLAEHSTFLDLHSLTFDDTSNTFRVMQLATQEGNLLSCINDIAESINARIEFAPCGTARVLRDPRYLSTAARNALPTVINFTSADILDISIGRDHVFNIGRCEASGGTYNSANNSVTPLLSLAPGHAQDEGESSITLSRQVLGANLSEAAAQAELNERCGHHLEAQRRRLNANITHPDGYGFMVPSHGAWYTITFSFPERGISYDSQTRWTCQSVTARYDENGTRSVSATYAIETRGTPGKAVTFPQPGAIPISHVDLPPFEAYPGFGIVEPVDLYTGGNAAPVDDAPRRARLRRDGNTVAAWSANRLFISTNFITGGSTPEWFELSPPVSSGGTIRAFAWDRFKLGAAYCLVDDGTNSSIYYVSDVLSKDWEFKSTIAGIYDVLRTTNAPGGIMIYSGRNLNSTVLTQTYTITFDPGGYPYTDVSPVPATLDPNGNPGNCLFSNKHPSEAIYIHMDLGGLKTVTEVGMDIIWYGNIYDSSRRFNFQNADNTWRYGIDVAPDGGFGGSGYQSWRTVYRIFTEPNVKKISYRWSVWTLDIYDRRLDNCYAKIQTTVGAGARVAYSNNYGETWQSIQAVGAFIPDTIGGFAVQAVGSHSYAAINEQVREATSLGGSYTNDGAPLTGTAPRLLWIPTRQWNSAAKNVGANPHYLVGSGALVSGEALWRDTGVRTAITPIVSGVRGLATSPNCAATWRGVRIGAILNFGGTRRLVVTTNAGNTWTDRGAQGANADWIRYLPLSKTGNELFWIDGAVARYSPNHGVTIRTKELPDNSTLRGIEPL